MKKLLGWFPKNDMGFPAVFREVGTKQKRPDVGILSLLSSRPQTLSLGCFLHHYPSVGVNRIEKAVVDRVSSRGCRNPRGTPKGSFWTGWATALKAFPLHTLPMLWRKHRGMQNENVFQLQLFWGPHTQSWTFQTEESEFLVCSRKDSFSKYLKCGCKSRGTEFVILLI